MEGTDCACNAENSHVSCLPACLFSCLLCSSFSSLSFASFLVISPSASPSIILHFPSFLALRLWLNLCPACQLNTVMIKGYFKLERCCSPLHGEHVISLSLYGRRVGMAQWLARCEMENLQCWCITLEMCVRARERWRTGEEKQGPWDESKERWMSQRCNAVFHTTCPVWGPVQRWVCQGSGWTSRQARSSAPPATSSPAAAPGHGGIAAGNLTAHT